MISLSRAKAPPGVIHLASKKTLAYHDLGQQTRSHTSSENSHGSLAKVGAAPSSTDSSFAKKMRHTPYSKRRCNQRFNKHDRRPSRRNTQRNCRHRPRNSASTTTTPRFLLRIKDERMLFYTPTERKKRKTTRTTTTILIFPSHSYLPIFLLPHRYLRHTDSTIFHQFVKPAPRSFFPAHREEV